ncbi:MAG: hypothetical protein ACOYT9_02490 [Patescibacteria group bacterium]
MAQGKRWNKKQIIELIEPYLRLGMSVTKACSCVGFSQSTVATWLKTDEELRLKFTALQKESSNIARTVVIQKMQQGDVAAAKWWLEKKERDEFGISEKREVDVDYVCNRAIPAEAIVEAINSLNDEQVENLCEALNVMNGVYQSFLALS